MENEKRLLIISGGMDQGGAETFLMKIFRETHDKGLIFDFYQMSFHSTFYDSEILALGGRIYYGHGKSESVTKYQADIKNFFKKHKYDYVLRYGSNAITALDFKYAKKYNPKTITIYRSANSNTSGGFISKMLHEIGKILYYKYIDKKIAPSTEAGIHMFPKGDFRIIPNAIDRSVFTFSQEARTKIREELKINDEKVFLHVGRFQTQKNHEYLFKIFKGIADHNKNVRFILVGKGENKKKFVSLVEENGLTEYFIFLENRLDVNQIMMAADILVFPSLFEGMPNVVIESLATGLPCLVSSTITKECALTPIVQFLDISNENIATWVNRALEKPLAIEQRLDYSQLFPTKYYVENAAKEFLKLLN